MAGLAPASRLACRSHDQAIPLDFNPETLTLKVSSGEQRDRGRRGRQQRQNVGASKATLSFECVFDSTRPASSQSGSDSGAQSEEMLDVRVRTMAIADLLQVQGDGRDQAPRRVQFRWGTIIFNGVISQHRELFDYFSPSGVPLRSKIQLTLTEQEFRYEISAEDAARRREQIDRAGSGARAQAEAANAASLLGSEGLGTGLGGGLENGLDLSTGFDLDIGLDANFDLGLSAELGFSAKLGVSADIGASLGAGIDLDVDTALDLFGSAALGGSSGSMTSVGIGPGPDLGRSSLPLSKPSPNLASTGRLPNTWAPEGPAPGSRAAELASVVTAQRSAGAAPTALTRSGAPIQSEAAPAAPLPVRGSPPVSAQRRIGERVPLFGAGTVPTATGRKRRPSWETLPTVVTTTSGHSPGCGCRRCRL